jgi:cellulase/cellobiase CelA1
VVPQVPAKAPPTAQCKYEVSSSWWGGGIGSVTITNEGATTIHGWTVSWTYGDGSYIQNYWNGAVTGSSPTFTATDVGWNHDIAPGQSASFGFVFAGGSGPDPVIPKVTGDICK